MTQWSAYMEETIHVFMKKKVIIMQKYAYLLERTIQKYVYNPMSNSFSIEISGYAR